MKAFMPLCLYDPKELTGGKQLSLPWPEKGEEKYWNDVFIHPKLPDDTSRTTRKRKSLSLRHPVTSRKQLSLPWPEKGGEEKYWNDVFIDPKLPDDTSGTTRKKKSLSLRHPVTSRKKCSTSRKK